MKGEFPNLGALSKSAVINQIDDQVFFVALRFRVDLGFKISVVLKKLEERVFAFGHEIVHERSLLRDIYGLQHAGVGERLRAREINHSNVQRRLQKKGDVNARRVGLDL